MLRGGRPEGRPECNTGRQFFPGCPQALKGGHGPTRCWFGLRSSKQQGPNPMTIDRVLLKDLIEKGSDADLLREMMAFVVNRMMDFEVESLTGAAHGERSADRTNHRNGYRERPWETRAGTIPVAIPKLRKGSYFPSFLEPRRTSEKALVAVIQEAYVQGISTRSVDDLVKAMGMSGISKSQVSRLCEEIDDRVKTFLERPIEGSWPYLWIDATYVKVREAGRIISVAVIIAVAVNTDGRREVLGLAVGPSEAEPFWSKFLRTLTARGLRGVKLVVSDAHEGLKAAAKKVFGATWQRCRVHRARRILGAVVAREQHGRRSGDRGGGPHRVGCRRRPAARALPAPVEADGRDRARRSGLHGLPEGALDAAAFHQPDRAAQSRGQAAHQRRCDLPQRRRHRPPRGCTDAGAE